MNGNEDWIEENRKRSKNWCFKNNHLMGNSKESLDNQEIFYMISDRLLYLCLRYPNRKGKGNIGASIEYDTSPETFAIQLNSTLKTLVELKYT